MLLRDMKSVARLLLGKTRVEVWHRGEVYANEGRVEILQCDDHEVTALVHGTQAYEVYLKPLARGIRKQCTCPYAGGDICKHMVATAIVWDELHGHARPVPERVEIETIHPPPISRKQLSICFAHPLEADLNIIRAAVDYYALSPKRHARLPKCPRIETFDEVPVTWPEIRSCLKEMENWTRRKTYHHYFCAGEMAAAFSEMLDVIYSRLSSSDPGEVISIMARCVDWYYHTFEQIIDGSDGVWIFPVARIGRIVDEILRRNPLHPAWEDFNGTVEDAGFWCGHPQLDAKAVARWKNGGLA